MALHKSLTGGGSRGGLGSAGREQGQDKGKRPQAGPGEAQLGQQQEFPHGKGAQALAGAAQGALESAVTVTGGLFQPQ